MPTTAPPPTKTFPAPVAAAVIASVENVFRTVCGEPPVRRPEPVPAPPRPCVIAVMSFDGTPPWTLACRLTDETAPALARQFAGFDIGFESADMGDVVGELLNVLSGEIVAQLESRRMKHRMSLPTVLRGEGIQIVPETGATALVLEYALPQGRLWFELIAPKGTLQTRMPGN